MPVRDALPLTLPAEVAEQAGRGAHAALDEPDEDDEPDQVDEPDVEEEPADLGPAEEDAVPARPTPRRRRR